MSDPALVIDEKAFGPDHPNVARDANNLGLVLKDLGDLDGARKALERALAIGETAKVAPKGSGALSSDQCRAGYAPVEAAA